LIQGKKSVFETDLMFPIIQYTAEISGIPWGAAEETDIAFKVLADHTRAASFLISEGITPSNEGRGYVLRRIIRRALRYGRALRFSDAFLSRITNKVIDLMGDDYAELVPSREYVAGVCRAEEEKFKSVVENATAQLEILFEEAGDRGEQRLQGKDVFKLYDTFGLPIDFVQEMANERNFEVDVAGFDEEMDQQRKRSTWKSSGNFETQELYRKLSETCHTVFTGYTRTEEENCETLQILRDFRAVPRIDEGETGEVILNKTPFYAESGGQLGDRGMLISSTGRAMVHDTQTPATGLVVHKVQMEKGYLQVGDSVNAIVDPSFRQSVRKNHTATHLLHATLRRILGDHVKQSGSLVAPDRLRFDFTHYTGLKADEVRDLEKQVNERVLSNVLVETKISTVDQAIADGAMALFGEKYGDQVRMVTIGDFSKELCGGTHCGSTGEVGAFLIARESSTAAGIRRIEALTGVGALEYIQQERRLVDDLSASLKTSPDEIVQRIQELMERNKKLEKEVERLKSKAMLGSGEADFTLDQSLQNGTRLFLKIFPEADTDQLGNFVDEIFRSGHYTVVAAGSVSSSSLTVRVAEGKDATTLFRKFYIPEFGGGGGGRKDFAKGGLKKLKELPPEESLKLLAEQTTSYLSG